MRNPFLKLIPARVVAGSTFVVVGLLTASAGYTSDANKLKNAPPKLSGSKPASKMNKAAAEALFDEPVAKPVTAAIRPPVKPVTKLPAKAPITALARSPKKSFVPAALPTPEQSPLAGYVRSVRAVDSSTNSVLSEINALAIGESFLLLPLDFVSDLALAKSEIRFFVADSGKNQQEVFLSDLDFNGGLALFKGAPAGLPSLPTAQVRETPPDVQEALRSLTGYENLKTGFHFIRAKQDVFAMHYKIAASSPQESANYIFDRSGKLVAVGFGAAKDGTLWTTAGIVVAELLKKASSPNPASAMTLSLSTETRFRQLQDWQNRWSKALKPSKRGYSLQYLDCHPLQAQINDVKVAAQIHRIEAKECTTPFALSLGGGYDVGIIVQTGEAYINPSRSFESNRDGSLQKMAQEFSNGSFREFNRSVASVNLLTTPECKNSATTNSAGQRVNVQYCTSALKGATGLNDTSIVVSTFDSTWQKPGAHAYVSFLRLKGFGQAQTRSVLEAVIENPHGNL